MKAIFDTVTGEMIPIGPNQSAFDELPLERQAQAWRAKLAHQRCRCGEGLLHEASGNSIPHACPAYDPSIPSTCQECPYRIVWANA